MSIQTCQCPCCKKRTNGTFLGLFTDLNPVPPESNSQEKELRKSDFRNMYESLEVTRNNLENSLKQVNHSIERFINRTPDPIVHDQEFFLKIIRDWKHSWMNQTQNSKEDYQNYFNRAFGIDSNMVHSLAHRIVKELEKK